MKFNFIPNFMKSVILSTGYSYPKKILTNDEISKFLDTNHEWVFKRTGICERRIAEEETTSSLGAEAAKMAIKNAKITSNEIDGIILATTTPDDIFPASATKIQKIINANNAFAFDIQAVCAGFIYAISVADSLIKNCLAKKILVIGSDVMSKLVDWSDRGTAILFGDGAGAMLLSGENDSSSGIVSTSLYSDGDKYYMLKTEETEKSGKKGIIKMNGKSVFVNAIKRMTESTENELKKNNLKTSDINHYIFHQANERIIDSIVEKLKLNNSVVIKNISKYGNTSAATIPTTLAILNESNKIKKDDKILISAMGAGFSWGTGVIIW